MVLEQYTVHSADETHELGKSLGQTLPKNAIIAFSGDLGAGKTTFIRGIVEGLEIDLNTVSSPTFSFLNIYSGNLSVYHFDLYRLPETEEFFKAGFDEYFTAGGVCCIEWAEKIATALPMDTITITISNLGEEKRSIEIARGK